MLVCWGCCSSCYINHHRLSASKKPLFIVYHKLCSRHFRWVVNSNLLLQNAQCLLEDVLTPAMITPLAEWYDWIAVDEATQKLVSDVYYIYFNAVIYGLQLAFSRPLNKRCLIKLLIYIFSYEKPIPCCRSFINLYMALMFHHFHHSYLQYLRLASSLNTVVSL